MVVINLLHIAMVVLMMMSGDLPGAEVELAVREGHCQVGTKEARLPLHSLSGD